MRPERLEMEGFTSFRDPTVVDFTGADVFALVGPTGSGKSSVVDAMGFALFGRVHRYGEKLVHAVISQGRNEARVRFDFTAGGSACTAVRVVRRTGPGRATTKEARLERDGEVVAGDEKGLTAAVTELLGLNFEQYCRCVVLPQGAFAEFLHDAPSGRQSLLSNLLDVGHYRRMGQEAGQRAAVARSRADDLEALLTGRFAGATTEAKDAAEARLAALEALAEKVTSAMPQLDDLSARVARAAAHAETAVAHQRLLEGVRAPSDVSEVVQAVEAARARAAEASQALEGAERRSVEAQAALDALGDRRPVDAALAAHQRRQQITERRVKAARTLEAARAAHVAAEAQAKAAEETRAGAERAVQAALASNRAHALLEHLEAGEACPVCQQVVHDVPALEEPADLSAARGALRHAEEVHQQAASRLEAASEARLRASAAVDALDAQLVEAERELGGFTDVQVAEAAAAAIDRAQAELAAAQTAERQARAASRAAEATVASSLAAEAEARRSFDTARDAVAVLGPPTPGRADLSADWEQLVAWASELAQEMTAGVARAAAEAEQLRTEHHRLQAEVETWCTSLGVTTANRPPSEAVAVAVASAQAELRQVMADIEAANTARQQLAAAQEGERVAHTLAVHLRADRFEKWLLDEALDELTEGATSMLLELSAGAYSLALDERSRDFAVVDHRNADEVRPVRTLSGGETFLASLALALALSERVAELAAGGAVKLEALFLDEGFGTLDADTLDTVASAIENLGASGRMVGLVTHVRDLADRVPVRFEVAKGPATSSVEKVVQ